MKILVGDILQSHAQTLINTVNCVGVMGKGIALEFKKRFPEMFIDYAEKCRRNEVRLGVPYLYKSLFPPQIVNFPTKDHWKSISKISDIERGLQFLVSRYRDWGIASLAVPSLGCGNGQLEWHDVGPLIYRYARQMDIPVEIYAPYGTPSRELTVKFLEQGRSAGRRRNGVVVQPALNPAWVALVEILQRVEEQPYHWPVGRIIFQKIAYVATQQGLPTGFMYQRGSFGPFCTELRSAQTKLVNNNLLQEEQRGKMFVVKVGPNYARMRNEFAPGLSRWESIIARTTDLFMRLNTDRAEIVATVMYAASSFENGSEKPSESQVLDYVMQWKQRRRPPIDKTEVASAIRNLGMLRWLDAKYDSALPVPADDAVFA